MSTNDLAHEQVTFSDELRARVRTANVKGYVLAAAAGLAPSQLSGWVNAHVPFRPDDPRALRLAQMLGVDASVAFVPWTPAPMPAAAAIEFRGRR